MASGWSRSMKGRADLPVGLPSPYEMRLVPRRPVARFGKTKAGRRCWAGRSGR